MFWTDSDFASSPKKTKSSVMGVMLFIGFCGAMLKFGIVAEDGIGLLLTSPKLKRSKSSDAFVVSWLGLAVIGVSKRFKLACALGTGLDWTGAPNKSSSSKLLLCLVLIFDRNKFKL